MNFEVSILLYAGTEEELSATVSGNYQPYERAFTYPGEYAPTDPPVEEGFSVESVVATVNGKPVDFLPILSRDQIAALEAEGLEYVAGVREEALYQAHEARQEARQEAASLREERDDQW